MFHESPDRQASLELCRPTRVHLGVPKIGYPFRSYGTNCPGPWSGAFFRLQFVEAQPRGASESWSGFLIMILCSHRGRGGRGHGRDGLEKSGQNESQPAPSAFYCSRPNPPADSLI